MKIHRSLTIYQALIILMISWTYTLMVNDFNFDDSLYKIYATRGIPFTLIIQVIAEYGKEKKQDRATKSSQNHDQRTGEA